MKFIGYKCDGCGETKKESNHWHRIVIDSARFTAYPWHVGETENESHICSDNCAVKALQDWLNKQKEDQSQ